MKRVLSGVAVLTVSALAAGGGVVLASLQTASADPGLVIIGHNPDPSGSGSLVYCSETLTVQRDGGFGVPSYEIPTAGTLTSFSFRAFADQGSVRLLVFDPDEDGNVTLVAKSDLNPVTTSTLNTFSINIAVEQGNVLGMQYVPLDEGTNLPCGEVSQDANGDYFPGGDSPPTGTTFAPSNPSPFRWNVSATLLPGDAPPTPTVTETATATATATETVIATATAIATVPGPTQTVTATPLAAPDTTAPETIIARAPRAKTHKKLAVFKFLSTDVFGASSFQCSIDGGDFGPCTSGVRQRFAPGRHTFAVRAADPAGNVDASPAEVSWKFIPRA